MEQQYTPILKKILEPELQKSLPKDDKELIIKRPTQEEDIEVLAPLPIVVQPVQPPPKVVVPQPNLIKIEPIKEEKAVIDKIPEPAELAALAMGVPPIPKDENTSIWMYSIEVILALAIVTAYVTIQSWIKYFFDKKLEDYKLKGEK